MLGKATIDTKTRGLTKGRNGSSSENFQNAGRELLTLDEVRQLDREKALLFISGERPVMDKKYDLMNHPNVHLTTDGGAAPYKHRPTPEYGLHDLPRPLDAGQIELIESEENEHEEPEIPQGTGA